MEASGGAAPNMIDHRLGNSETSIPHEISPEVPVRILVVCKEVLVEEADYFEQVLLIQCSPRTGAEHPPPPMKGRTIFRTVPYSEGLALSRKTIPDAVDQPPSPKVHHSTGIKIGIS